LLSLLLALAVEFEGGNELAVVWALPLWRPELEAGSSRAKEEEAGEASAENSASFCVGKGRTDDDDAGADGADCDTDAPLSLDQLKEGRADEASTDLGPTDGVQAAGPEPADKLEFAAGGGRGSGS